NRLWMRLVAERVQERHDRVVVLLHMTISRYGGSRNPRLQILAVRAYQSADKLSSDSSPTRYSLCTNPLGKLRVARWRSRMSLGSVTNRGIPLPMRTGTLVITIR